MSLIEIPGEEWGSQPQYPVNIDSSNPRARGLNVATTPIGGGNSHRLITPGVLVTTGLPTQDTSQKGIGVRGGTGKFVSAIAVTNTPPFSLLFAVIPKSLSATQGIWTFGASGTENTPRLLIQSDTADLRFYFNGGYQVTKVGALVVDKPITIAFTADGVTGRCYVDGVDIGSAAAAFTDLAAQNWYYGSGFNGAADFLYLEQYQWGRVLTGEDMAFHHQNLYKIFEPEEDYSYFSAAGGAAALAGTITGSNEGDIVTGGKTIILTLTGDTFLAAGTGPIGSTANTQALIDGIDSAQAEATGWDAVVKAGLTPSNVVRTSSTVATITLPAFASYDITATETITATIPAAVLTLAAPIVAAPTFTVTATTAGGWLQRGYLWNQHYGNMR